MCERERETEREGESCVVGITKLALRGAYGVRTVRTSRRREAFQRGMNLNTKNNATGDASTLPRVCFCVVVVLFLLCFCSSCFAMLFCCSFSAAVPFLLLFVLRSAHSGVVK